MQVLVCAARYPFATDNLMCPQPPSLCVARAHVRGATHCAIWRPHPRLFPLMAAWNSWYVLPVLHSAIETGDGIQMTQSSIRRNRPLMARSIDWAVQKSDERRMMAARCSSMADSTIQPMAPL